MKRVEKEAASSELRFHVRKPDVYINGAFIYRPRHGVVWKKKAENKRKEKNVCGDCVMPVKRKQSKKKR
jgi:hypothetical protein